MTERNDENTQATPRETPAATSPESAPATPASPAAQGGETQAQQPQSQQQQQPHPRREGGGGPRREGGGGGRREGGPRGQGGPRREGGPGGGPGGRRPRKQYFRKRKVCRFCVERIDYIDYKKADMLQGFVQDRGKVLPRRLTGTCSQHQRWLITAIKRARNIALLPFAQEL